MNVHHISRTLGDILHPGERSGVWVLAITTASWPAPPPHCCIWPPPAAHLQVGDMAHGGVYSMGRSRGEKKRQHAMATHHGAGAGGGRQCHACMSHVGCMCVTTWPLPCLYVAGTGAGAGGGKGGGSTCAGAGAGGGEGGGTGAGTGPGAGTMQMNASFLCIIFMHVHTHKHK